MRKFKVIQLLSMPLCLAAFGVLGCSADARSEGVATGETQQALAPGSDAAFVWSGGATGSFDAPTGYTYTSGSGKNHITQLATGQYRVDFAGLASPGGGDVQVTAYGGGSERCKVLYWTSAGTALQAFVNCYTATGAPVNTVFTASYQRRGDHPGADGAYVWANDAASSYYLPSTGYLWNSSGGTISISHTPGSGAYAVSIPGQNLGAGTVEVTAYGGSNSYCKVAGWGGSVVNVACFNGTTGAPIESQFDLVFSTKSPNNIWSYSYLWAYSPSTPSYTVGGSYQKSEVSCCTDGNGYPFGPAQSPATVTRYSTGYYNVKFPGLATGGGGGSSNVKVTGYGSGSDTCKVVGWYTSGNDAYANVACFAANGAAADAYYTITYSSFAATIG